MQMLKKYKTLLLYFRVFKSSWLWAWSQPATFLDYCNEYVYLPVWGLVHGIQCGDDYVFYCTLMLQEKSRVDHSCFVSTAVLCWSHRAFAWWASAERIWSRIWVSRLLMGSPPFVVAYAWQAEYSLFVRLKFCLYTLDKTLKFIWRKEN